MIEDLKVRVIRQLQIEKQGQTEEQLAAQLGTEPSLVRQALEQLRHDGLVFIVRTDALHWHFRS